MGSVREILEIDKILGNVSKYSKTINGKSFIESLDVFSNEDDCRKELDIFNESYNVYLEFGSFPISSKLDLYEEIKNIKKGGVLDPLKLNLLKDEIFSIKELIKFFDKIDGNKFPLLKNISSNLFFCEDIYNKIIRTVSVDNTIYDNASPKLKDLRRKSLLLDREIHTAVNKLMVSYKDKLSGDSYVLRDGRFVLPISTNLKASVDGIIHDVSDSGQTTFIEPTSIVNLENEKMVYVIQEKEEITRILKEISFDVVSNETVLLKNDAIIIKLDVLSSKINYLNEIQGIVPILLKNKEIRLYGARHPLLDKETVVPNDFFLGDDKTMLLISGPNAGGKTIALKTVAICAYMIKLGLPIPCNEGSGTSFFRKVYIDIGDSQSIENNLSTFSGHMSILSTILKYISSNDLVVIDELGNGTDPKEGESLSMSVAEFLVQRKCLTLITSHYQLLKQYGLANKNVLSASFIFDEKRIEPTFKMLLNVSGKSYGFLIAEKYGLNQTVINRAREIYEKNFVDVNDKKIEILEEKERIIHQKEEDLNKKRNDINLLNNELKKKSDKLDEKEKKLKEGKIDQFDEYVDKKIDELDDIVDEFKKHKNLDDSSFVKRIKDISLIDKEKEVINCGDYVLIKSLNLQGKVTKIDKNRVNLISTSGFSVKASLDDCIRISGPKREPQKIRNIDNEILNQKQVSSSLNLIGYHVDEALDSLDKYLDDCRIRKLKVVKIIHGYGTGKLRNGIHTHLKTLPFVESFRLGTDIDGGTGATIVTLK